MTARLVQFAIACVIGSTAFLALAGDPNYKVPYLGGFLAGVFGQWLTVFAWVWARHGWRAARSLSFG